MTTGSVSPRRADTRQNHERILAAARTALTACGDLSFNAIAKQAGVGVGTVYRHFTSQEALVVAVYRREVENLVDIVPKLLADEPPEQAFRSWTGHLANYLMTKRGLAKALGTAAMTAKQDLVASAQQAMLTAVTALVAANVAAGTIRADLEPATVLRALAGGMILADPAGDWRAQTEQLTDLIWSGLRAD
jgi:AcrR family transcriptional regulator